MIRSSVAVLVLANSFCVEAAAGKKPVTPEAAAASRDTDRIRSLVWAPDGKRFAFEESGVIYVCEAASGAQREVVSKSRLETEAEAPAEPGKFPWRNRRVREQKIQWFPSGEELLLSVKGDLFRLRLGENGWTQLTATAETEHDPKLSPDGRRISFRRDHELYVLDLGSRKVRRLTRDGSPTRWNAELDWVYPEELELGTAHWWSPDSKQIAYMQFDVSREMLYPHADLLKLRAVAEPQRYPQAGTPNAEVRLGVVSTGGGKTRWLEPRGTEDTLLARVHWLPDSTSLAVQRLNRIQDHLELLVAPARGGRARTLLEENDPYWVNVADDLRFLEKSDRMIWTSERDGRRHIYLYSLEGNLEARLTSGDWEVTAVVEADEEGGRVYYVSTEQSPLERHLYSARFDGQDRKRLTEQPGVHSISMSPTCEYYLDTHSSHTQPPRRTVHDGEGEQVAVFREANRKSMEEYELLPAEIVEVRASDGQRLYARLVKPAGFRSGEKYPAVVIVYGGPHAQEVRNSWQGVDWEQALAHRDFVVWQLDNRGSGGRGHAWEATLYRRFGEQELADQREGVRHLVSLGFVDPSRIGIYGWSYGGFMTLYSLLHAPEVFRAGVAGAPVTDWRHYDTIYTERYLGLPDDNEEGYRLSSPVHFADQLEGALMLIHNFEDDNVLFQHTLRMADALERAGKPFDLMIYPQKAHGVTGKRRKHMLAAAAAFLERELKR